MSEEDMINSLELLGENEYLHKEIERLNNNIDKAIEYMNEVLECNYHGGNVTFDALVHNTEHILRGSDKE
jgi:hypothetical protein